MILIADSGSTKTEWREIKDGRAGRSYISTGINPFFFIFDEAIAGDFVTERCCPAVDLPCLWLLFLWWIARPHYCCW